MFHNLSIYPCVAILNWSKMYFSPVFKVICALIGPFFLHLFFSKDILGEKKVGFVHLSTFYFVCFSVIYCIFCTFMHVFLFFGNIRPIFKETLVWKWFFKLTPILAPNLDSQYNNINPRRVSFEAIFINIINNLKS